MPTFQLTPDLLPVSRLCFGPALNSLSLSLCVGSSAQTALTPLVRVASLQGR
jgi:hypothetical protein